MKFLISCLVFSSFLVVPGSVSLADESDECGFGYESSIDLDTLEDTCEKNVWTVEKKNDGFSSTYMIWMDADEDDWQSDESTTLVIYCENRKLGVQIYSDPDMFADSNLAGWGTAQVRIDSRRIQRFSYRELDDFSGVYFPSPKKLTAAILSGKKKIAVKIGTLNGYNVSVFPKSNLASYASKFRSKGCPLK